MLSTKALLRNSEVSGNEIKNDKNEVLKQIYILTDIFKRTFIIHRNIGATPLQLITFYPTSKECKLKYYKFIFSYKSKQFVYSLLLQIVLLSAIVFIAFHFACGNVNVARYIRTSLLPHVHTNNGTETSSF